MDINHIELFYCNT